MIVRHRKKAVLTLLSAILIMLINLTTLNLVKANPTRVSMNYLGSPTIFDITMVPGTQFTINVTVDYVEELWGYQFNMTFNPNVLNVVNYQNGPFLASAGGRVMWLPGPGFDNTKGKLGLFSAALNPKLKFPTGGGVLCNITFQVVGYGASPIRFEVNSGLANKTGGWILGPEWKPIHLSAPVWDTATGKWILRDHNPDAFIHGTFDNRPPMYVSPSEIIGVSASESFSVNISVADMKDIYSWSFYLNWTAALLNITDITQGDFGSFTYEINNEAGYLHIGGSTVVSGSGALANITFIVKGLGKSNLTLSKTQMLDSASNPVPHRTENAFFANDVHDIAIIEIKPYPTKVKAGSGDIVYIDVKLRNAGAFAETGINVTTYYEEKEIGKQTAISLEMREIKTLTFAWNTTGIAPGKYKIKAVATTVVNETDTADNTYSYRGGWVTVFLRNVAVITVTTPVSKVFSGYDVIITVVVRNRGTEIESFDVTAYANSTTAQHKIETKHVMELGYLESRTLQYMWNITGDIELGEYTIWAQADPMEGEDDISDNKLVKVGKLQIIAFEEEFPTELAALSIAAVVVVGSVIFFVKRRKPGEDEGGPIEEFEL